MMNTTRSLSPTTLVRLRTAAAMIATASGTGHIAALWFRDLDAAALNGALFGTLYLIIGIGLFGQSRLSLFLAIVIPACGSLYIFRVQPSDAISSAQLVSAALALLVMVLSALVLWNVRNQPTA